MVAAPSNEQVTGVQLAKREDVPPNCSAICQTFVQSLETSIQCEGLCQVDQDQNSNPQVAVRCAGCLHVSTGVVARCYACIVSTKQ